MIMIVLLMKELKGEWS